MELLLTPLVNRILGSVVKSSTEGAGAALKASVSGSGGILLHNLELNLDPLLQGVTWLRPRRAFAKRLSLTIPWTALRTQPIQVVLDTVELVLIHSSSDPPESPGSLGAAAEAESWLGSTLQSLALRAGLNLSLVLRNVVIKYVAAPDFVASIAFQDAALATCPASGWRDTLDRADAWLKKQCSIQGLSVCIDPLDEHSSPFDPVLRTNRLTITALLPIFAYLERTDLGGDDFKVTVAVEVEPITVSVNDRQIAWAGALNTLLLQGEISAAGAPDAAADGAGPRPRGGASGGDRPQPAPESTGIHETRMKALGMFGRVWDYIADEATYLESLEDAPTAPAAEALPASAALTIVPMHAELGVSLHGVALHLGVVRNVAPAPAEQQQFAGNEVAGALAAGGFETRHSQLLESTLAQLQHITSAADAAEVQRQLSQALEAEECVAAPWRHSNAPSAIVHPLLEAELAGLELRTTSTDSTMQSVELELIAVSARYNISCTQLAAETLSPGPPCEAAAAEEPRWDEVFGLHHMRSPLAVAPDQMRNVSTALQARWYNAEEGGAGRGASQRCAVQVGQIWAAYMPGLATNVALLASKFGPPPDDGSALPAPTLPAPAPDDPETEGWLAGWMRAGALINVDVGALQLAALSSQGLGASAVLFSARRMLCHSGALNWTSPWNRTLRQALLAPPEGYPGHGLRLSVAALAFSVADGSWQARRSRAGQLDDVPGCVPFTNTNELHGVVTANAQHRASVALSPMEMSLSGQQLAAAMAVLAGLSAERGHCWQQSLPHPLPAVHDASTHWMSSLKLSADSIQALYGVGSEVEIAPPSIGSQEAPDRACLWLCCSNVLTQLETAARQGGKGVAASLQLSAIEVQGLPGWSVQLGLAAVHLDAGSGAGPAGEPRQDEPFLLAAGCVVLTSDVGTTCHVSSIALASHAADTAALAALLDGMAGRAALPAFPSYPELSELTASAQSGGRGTTAGVVSVHLDTVCFTVYPPCDGSAAATPVGLVGLTGWLAGVDCATGSASGRSLVVGSLQLGLCRDGLPPMTMSPAISCASLPLPAHLSQQAIVVTASQVSDVLFRFDAEVAPLSVSMSPELILVGSSVVRPLLTGHPASTSAAPCQPPPCSVQLKPLLVALIHGKVVAGAITARMRSTALWEADVHASATEHHAAVFHADQLLLLVEEEDATFHRPWLAGSGALLTTLNASFLGAAVAVHHAGQPGADITQCLKPTDFTLQAQLSSAADALAVTLQTVWLPLQVSMPAVLALSGLASSLTAMTHGEEECGSLPEACLATEAPLWQDDLRSGMFTLTDSTRSLAPLCIFHTSLPADGSGGEEGGSLHHILRWRYPHPRVVQVLRFEGLDTLLHAAMTLAYNDAIDGSWIELPTRISCVANPSAASSIPGDLYSFSLAGAHAEEWELSWVSSSVEITAAQVLRRLHINPSKSSTGWRSTAEQLGIQMETVPALLAATTVVVAAERGNLTFLAPVGTSYQESAPLVMLDTVAEVAYSGMHVALRQHGQPSAGMSVDAKLLAGLQYVDGMMMSLSTLLEPVGFAICYERSISADIFQQQSAGPITETADVPAVVACGSDDWLDSQTGILSAARPPPRLPGTLLVIEAVEEPLVVNFSELTPHDLRRLLRLFSNPGTEAPSPPMQFLNSMPGSLLMRQVGTNHSVLLPCGTLKGFNWFVPPACGAECAIQLALPPAASALAVVWSDPVEVVGARSSQLALPTKGAAERTCNVALQIDRKGGLLWHIDIRPVCSVVNHFELPLHLSHEAGDTSTALTLPAGDRINLCLSQGSCLRIWLGESWSVELELPTVPPQCNRQVVLQARSRAGDEAPAAARFNSVAGHIGSLLAQVDPGNLTTGQVDIALCPPVVLDNELPFTVMVTLPDASTFAVGPGNSRHVPVASIGSSACLRFSICKEGAALPSTAGITIQLPCLGPRVGDSTGGGEADGQAVTIRLPLCDAKSVDCLLLRARSTQVASTLRLRLVPAVIVCNRMPLPISLQVPHGASIEVPADSMEAANWLQMDPNPTGVSLRILCETSTQDHLVPLTSEFFPTDLSHDTPIMLVGTSSSGTEVFFPASASVEVQQLAEDIDQATIAITSGVFVTNLTDMAIAVQCAHPAGCSLRKSGAGHYVLKPDATGSLPFIWDKVSPTTAPSAHRHSFVGGAGVASAVATRKAELRLALLPAEGTGDCPSQPFTWSQEIDMLSPTPSRQRLRLQAEGLASMLTYRVLTRKGRAHLVVFRDPQPPVVIQNAAPRAVQIGIFPPFTDEPIEIHCLPPGGLLECACVDSKASEDDDAFSDALQGDGFVSNQATPAIRVRVLGDKWGPPCSLSPGETVSSNFKIQVSRTGATTHVSVNSSDCINTHQPLVSPQRVLFRFREVQLSLWDDERRHLQGDVLDAGEDVNTAEEVLCATVLSLEAMYEKHHSNMGHLEYTFHVTAAALHLDRHMQNVDPVILTTECDSIAKHSTELDILLKIGVVGGQGADLSLDSAWVEQLQVTWPSFFVVAIDDDLLQLASRVQRMLLSSSESQPPDATPCNAGIFQDLQTEAKSAAGSRLWLTRASLSPLYFLADVHLSPGACGAPVAIDTHRSPFTLSRIAVEAVMVGPDVLIRGLAAHIMAETMLNMPQLFGSLQLLLNPTGLIHSVQRGVADLINMPMAGWHRGSATQFFAGVGRGSASLLSGISGWTFTSITGFSEAAVKALEGSSRVARIMSAPVSGALSVVGSITAGIAAGLAPPVAPRRHGRIIAVRPDSHADRSFTGVRLLTNPALVLSPGLAAGRYLGHWIANDVTIYQGTRGLNNTDASLASFTLTYPILLLTSAAVVLYSDNGLTPVLVMALAGSEHSLRSVSLEIEIFASAAAPANNPAALSSAGVLAHFHRHVWLELLPYLRTAL